MRGLIILVGQMLNADMFSARFQFDATCRHTVRADRNALTAASAASSDIFDWIGLAAGKGRAARQRTRLS